MIFAVGIRVVEYLSSFSEFSIDFTAYTNSFWFVGVTMTTIGYGDFFPNTSAG